MRLYTADMWHKVGGGVGKGAAKANPFEAAKSNAASAKKTAGAAGAGAGGVTLDAMMAPSTTALSPYLKFGCVSVRTFYHELHEVLNSPELRSKHTKPPESLEAGWCDDWLKPWDYPRPFSSQRSHLLADVCWYQ
jgi:cryptochrome